MTYLKSLEEFEKAAERLYLQNPMKARYNISYRHNKGLVCLKMTDDVTCLQYKTENQQELRKLEIFLNNLMRHMASNEN
ncbi:signal recognition particle 9 kDa protein [Neocloeon triangulifer]|uniref:signal recognition particle 9 kDa protein n=1 Tax=Neocloeon triangulifer TaxID=2078957 RepID=UPI00286F1188|nr:signal recognition particle 9 kDa protein [Neocloeon triangulifer]